MNLSSEEENQRRMVSKIVKRNIYIFCHEEGVKKKEEEEGNHYDDSEYEYEYVDGYQDAQEPLSQDSGE